MYYDLTNIQGWRAVISRLRTLRKLGFSVVIEIYKKTRSSQQNRALHKMFDIIADQLNEIGHTWKVLDIFEVRYNKNIIKYGIWAPIQLTLYGTTSTKKLTTEHINEIVDVLAAHYSNLGIVIEFPSIEKLISNLE